MVTKQTAPPEVESSTLAPPFASFCEAVRELLDETAADKGYQRTGLTGPNPMYAFVAETVGGPGHALGEIVYKVRRYAARGNPDDLLKIAAWAYLVWRFDRDGQEQAHG